jgi:nucleoside-diphosphate-sugar epimerase
MAVLESKKVLVAGGAGFIGSQMVRELLELGAEVSVYDNLLHGTMENLTEVKRDVEVIIGDLLDEFKLISSLQKTKPEYIFDFVGDTYVPTAYDIPKRFFNINTIGTMNLLLASHMVGIERILYVSSTEIYGEPYKNLPMTEEHIINPYNTYAVSKVAADRLCYTLNKEKGIPVIIARIYNSYGPRETEPYVIPEIISQLDKGNIVKLGNVKARRDFTYVSDTCKGLIATILSSIPNGEAVNVGSGQDYSIEELVEIIANIMGKEYEIVVEEERLRKFDIEIFLCNPFKLMKATGWNPTIDIKHGLEMTIDWYKSHGRKWSWESWTEGTILHNGKIQG